MGNSQEIYQSKNKQKHQREKSVEYRGETYKNAIMFFGERALDFQQALKNGIVDKNTNIVCIERDFHIAEKIKTKFPEKDFPNLHIVNNDFCKIDFSQYFTAGSIDYINFDICGYMSFPIMETFDGMSYLFSDKMRFHATLHAVIRRPKKITPIIKNIMWYASDEKKSYNFDILNWLKKYCQKNYTTEENFSWISSELQESISYQLAMIANLTVTHWFKIDRFSVYRNNDVNSMASHMVSIDCDEVLTDKSLEDIEVYDCRDFVSLFNNDFREDNKNYNDVEFYFPNNNVASLFFDMPPIKKGKRIQRVKTDKENNIISYRNLFKIVDRNDLEIKLNKVGFRAYITRIAKQKNTTPKRIIAGIKRELTCEEKQIGQIEIVIK
jgi:hypothetical protein